MKKLVKIYRDKAVYLINNDTIIVENIPLETAEILDFYKNIKKCIFVLDN